MDFKVLKEENIKIDDHDNIYYLNSKKEKKQLEIITPILYLPFGLDKDTKSNLYLNLQLRKTSCHKTNSELKLFLEFLESIEKKIKNHTGKEVKSLIRKNGNHEPIINTKVINKYKYISTDVFKNKENFNLYKIEKESYLKCNLLIDKYWDFNDIIFYKIKLKQIFIESV
jgi:hypothetical protein